MSPSRDRPLRARWRTAVLDPDSGLSWAARLAACAYAEHSVNAEGRLRYSPSLPTLASWMGVAVRVAWRARTELAEAGFLDLEEHKGQTSEARLTLPSRAPDARPTPAPTHARTHAPDARRTRGTRGTRENPLSEGAQKHPHPKGSEHRRGAEETGAKELVAFFVGLLRANGASSVPKKVRGQVGKEVGQLLAEGMEAEAIRRALELLVEKRLHPSTLASLSTEAQLGPAQSGKAKGQGFDWSVAEVYNDG